jgi:WD40 repeat protein
LWNLKGQLVEKLDYHDDPVLAVCFSENGRYLASGDGTGEVVIYDIQKKCIVLDKKLHDDAIRGISFWRYKHIITASWDKSVQIINN